MCYVACVAMRHLRMFVIYLIETQSTIGPIIIITSPITSTGPVNSDY